MWRAAGWMAVITSSLLLGVDPTDYRYTFEASGRGDGPSAGALVTVATLAAMLGHTIKAEATMTGTINPDGTIGPVGGIPYKIEGAAAAKKKLVLIPIGQQFATEGDKKKKIDVVERGKNLGVEVREVGDVYQAYELLTGQALPKPPGAGDGKPVLPGATAERLQEKTNAWLARYQEYRKKYESVPAQYRGDYINRSMEAAAAAHAKAEHYGQQKLAGAAYGSAVAAAANASNAYHSAKAVQGYITAGMSGANAHFKSVKPTLKIEVMLEQLGARTPATLGEVVTLADAYGNLGLAMGLIEMGDTTLEYKTSSREQGVLKVAAAAWMYAYADQTIDITKDVLDIGVSHGKAPAPSPEKVQSLAELFRRAAEANLKYFESVVIDEYAQEMGVHPDRAKNIFAYYDFNYTFAYAAAQAMEPMKKRTRGDTATTYATLGGALNSYVASSLLVARYYSLGLKMDEDGNIATVENEAALTHMLSFAEKRAQEVIGRAVAVEGEPVQPILRYDDARAHQEAGDTLQRFSALTGFWSAALQGQVITTLTGKAGVLREAS
jgi:predicted S18 family serine protease